MLPDGDLSLHGLKVLLVEDNVDNLQLSTFLFESYGADVIAVSSASDAFQALLERQPDILVSDIGLPDESGYTLIRRIRALSVEEGGQTLAIALTGSVQESDRKQALAAGFQQHLSKPVGTDTLLKTVLNVVSTKIG
ncbi:response regulator [Oculatella sp. FACHB-28]|uniref:response regulator n=1 Tax=Oculatella sp. FACHB-28 TaxID=2692845 RepID=UPI001685DF63|nr:response regulator [Oculatella sp. FACHB-28]MBD2054599.1 response regulator [Oculatella sp. FACHB-28]